MTQTYTYDNVNRITSATEGGWSRSYHYDAFGNRAMQGSLPVPALAPLCVLHNVAGCSTAAQDVADRPAYDANTNRFNADWAQYDNAGNVIWYKDPVGTAARQWSAAYDAVNKQTLFCDGGVAPCTSGTATGGYSYDGDGNRVKKTVGSVTTTYVYDAFGKLTQEYSSQAPSGGAQTLFRTLDHLGSTRLVTDVNGDVVSRRDFFPFGEEIPANSSYGNRQLVVDGQASTTYNASTAFTQKFTAKERDEESELDYFLARYYASTLGRFNSVDPGNAGAVPSIPHSWNAYGYANGQPLVLVDPDGRAPAQQEATEQPQPGVTDRARAFTRAVRVKSRVSFGFEGTLVSPGRGNIALRGGGSLLGLEGKVDPNTFKATDVRVTGRQVEGGITFSNLLEFSGGFGEFTQIVDKDGNVTLGSPIQEEVVPLSVKTLGEEGVNSLGLQEGVISLGGIGFPLPQAFYLISVQLEVEFDTEAFQQALDEEAKKQEAARETPQ